MRRTTISQEYFDWLYKKIDRPNERSYRTLCKLLDNKKFRWSVHNDDNRCEDGLNLRRMFAEDMDENHLEVKYFLKGDCTVFEMLVALAQRMNDLTYDLKTHDDRTPKWFHKLIINLGLKEYDDSWRFKAMDEIKIDEILEIMLDRTYGYYGNGGLFPMKRRPPKDMSEVEIYYQLMYWLDENYG